MGGTFMIPVDYSDVQGLVRFGFGKMTEAIYALMRIRNTSAARAWLRGATITSAVAMNPPPSTALQVAFTADEMTRLKKIFPGGVCDWSKPGVDQQPFAGTWQTFNTERGTN